VLQAQDLWTPAAESYAGSPTTAMRLWRTRVEDDGSFFSLDGITLDPRVGYALKRSPLEDDEIERYWAL
jgi:hypothetical protein